MEYKETRKFNHNNTNEVSIINIISNILINILYTLIYLFLKVNSLYNKVTSSLYLILSSFATSYFLQSMYSRLLCLLLYNKTVYFLNKFISVLKINIFTVSYKFYINNYFISLNKRLAYLCLYSLRSYKHSTILVFVNHNI